jgi:hypothetical protein
MFSPMMPVVVLAVLWLIVVVPMLIKRNDDRAGERSVRRFGGAMRTLASTRRSLGSLARPAAGHADAEVEDRPSDRNHDTVPGTAATAPPASRRPVPAAMEAAMYPERIGKADMSDARRQMMARRRRSLTLLVVGAAIGLIWGIAVGGMLAWTVGMLFAAGLVGYLSFLRRQALRDRGRREARMARSGLGQDHSYEVTERLAHYADVETVVRIDDDDPALHGLADTIDLTGLYQDEEFDDRAMRRAV